MIYHISYYKGEIEKSWPIIITGMNFYNLKYGISLILVCLEKGLNWDTDYEFRDLSNEFSF